MVTRTAAWLGPAQTAWTDLPVLMKGRSLFGLAVVNGSLTALGGWDVSKVLFSST